MSLWENKSTKIRREKNGWHQWEKNIMCKYWRNNLRYQPGNLSWGANGSSKWTVKMEPNLLQSGFRATKSIFSGCHKTPIGIPWKIWGLSWKGVWKQGNLTQLHQFCQWEWFSIPKFQQQFVSLRKMFKSSHNENAENVYRLLTLEEASI